MYKIKLNLHQNNAIKKETYKKNDIKILLSSLLLIIFKNISFYYNQLFEKNILYTNFNINQNKHCNMIFKEKIKRGIKNYKHYVRENLNTIKIYD